MIRYLKEKDVAQILAMPKAVELVEAALRERTAGRAIDIPRSRTRIPAGTLQMMQAASPALQRIGFKVYYTTPGKITSYYVNLFDSESGKLEAIIEANYLGMMRTGAASGVATRYMGREDATVLATIGAGKQAVGQLEAVCAVREISEVRVYSRNTDKARKFCATMSDKLGVTMRAVESIAETVRGAHVINVITKASTPALKGEWLEPGQHINAAGANSFVRRELDDAAVERCARVAVDSRATARIECGDLLPLIDRGLLDWDSLPELGEIIVGRVPGRQNREEITLFESQGMAIEDLYTAKYVVDTARAKNIGVDLPIGD